MKKTIAVLAALTILIGGCSVKYRNSERTVETTIIDKERVCSGRTCKYLVYTDDGTFKLVDSWGILAPMRFNTSDVYGRIETGPATLTVQGYRLGFFSEYPNITEIEQP